MIKRNLIVAMVVLSIFALQLQCKIVDFKPQSVFVTVTLEKMFHVASTTSSFSKSQVLPLADAYEGIAVQNIEAVNLVAVAVMITRNGTGAGTTASGQILFANAATPLQQQTLASFTNVNLNQVLNNPITPFSAQALLNMNPDGVADFLLLVSQVPPATLILYFNGSVNQPPVDFDANVKITLQLKLKQS